SLRCCVGGGQGRRGGVGAPNPHVAIGRDHRIRRVALGIVGARISAGASPPGLTGERHHIRVSRSRRGGGDDVRGGEGRIGVLNLSAPEISAATRCAGITDSAITGGNSKPAPCCSAARSEGNCATIPPISQSLNSCGAVRCLLSPYRSGTR